MLILRLICAAYWVLLTVLLLVPDPGALFGIQRIPGYSTGVGVHFALFAVLGVLVLASRVSLEHALLAGLLTVYAITTELLQALVPLRTIELRDFAENLLGLAAGIAIWWIARKYVLRRPEQRN